MAERVLVAVVAAKQVLVDEVRIRDRHTGATVEVAAHTVVVTLPAALDVVVTELHRGRLLDEARHPLADVVIRHQTEEAVLVDDEAVLNEAAAVAGLAADLVDRNQELAVLSALDATEPPVAVVARVVLAPAVGELAEDGVHDLFGLVGVEVGVDVVDGVVGGPGVFPFG